MNLTCATHFSSDETQNVKKAVVFLHGFGADGQDLIGLAPFMGERLPECAFYAPDGPEVCELSPFGRQWFSLEESDPALGRRRAETQAEAFENMYEYAHEVAPILEETLQQIRIRHRLENKDITLVGFSQGTMMALHIGLRQTNPFCAIVGFSGALVGASHLGTDLKSPTDILLIHGNQDDMLPVHSVDLAAQALQENEIPVTVKKYDGLGHSINAAGATLCRSFLKERL